MTDINFKKIKAWPFQEALKLKNRISKINNKQNVTFETGYGPSGDPHIGTFAEVLRTNMVRNCLEQISNFSTNLITFSDDLDALKKVPDDYPFPEKLEKYIDCPLSAIPDFTEKYKSYADRNNNILQNFLNNFGFEYNFISSTDFYKKGNFDKQLLIILENYEKIMDVILPTLRKERRESYSTFLPICKDSKKVLQVPIKIIDKQNGIIAGLDFCKTAFKLIGKETNFKPKIKDGKKIKKNKVIAEIKAKTKTILIAERTALNFLNHASGIATLTNKFVKKVGNKTKICCTRKTTPNLRLLEKYSVKKGGGYNHRYNLSDEILIKDNHINAENNLKKLIKKAIKTKKIITVEIENSKQLNQVLGIKFKRILFDNMSPKQLKKCLKICKNKYETEYSGNATLKNIKKISNTGINRISVGAITHSAKSFDVSLELSS